MLLFAGQARFGNIVRWAQPFQCHRQFRVIGHGQFLQRGHRGEGVGEKELLRAQRPPSVLHGHLHQGGMAGQLRGAFAAGPVRSPLRAAEDLGAEEAEEAEGFGLVADAVDAFAAIRAGQCVVLQPEVPGPGKLDNRDSS